MISLLLIPENPHHTQKIYKLLTMAHKVSLLLMVLPQGLCTCYSCSLLYSFPGKLQDQLLFIIHTSAHMWPP